MPLAWTKPDPKPKDIARTVSYVADTSEFFEVGSAQGGVFTHKKLGSTMIEVSALIQRQKIGGNQNLRGISRGQLSP